MEAALSLAMLVLLVCLVAGWETATKIAAAPFMALVVVFAVRVIYRKRQGATWDEAWGRAPADRR